MTFLPIVDRELRVASRRTSTHWLRFFAAAVVIVLFILIAIFNQRMTGNQQFGKVVFHLASALAFGFALLAGVFLTSDCLCSERRDGTLGLLFLTDLHGYDVVLGKLVATSVVSVYGLLAAIPVLGLPLLMGGVSGAEFVRMVLVLLTTLFLSLACGMFASAFARDTRAAMILSFALVLALTGAVLLIALLAGRAVGTTKAIWLMLPSPLLGFLRVSDVWHQFGSGAPQYWWSNCTVALIAITLLAMACRRVRHSWQESGSEPAREAKRLLPAARDYSLFFALNPFAWLTARDSFPGKWTRVFLGLLFAAWLVFYTGVYLSLPRTGPLWFVTAFCIAFGLHALVKGLMAAQATRRLCEDRQSGALELLLATRLSPSEVLGGQWHTLWKQFRWLLWALTLVNLLLVFAVLGGVPGDMGPNVALLFSSFFLGGIVLLWVDFRAIGWLGMWTALSGIRQHRAVLNTLARILGPPWLAIFLFVAMMVSGGGSSLGTVFVCWMVWFVLSIVSARMVAVKRKRELFDGFRQLAAGDKPSPVSEKPRLWSPEWETTRAVSHSSSGG